MGRVLSAIGFLLLVLGAPAEATAQRRYGEARSTARAGIGLGASDLGVAASVEAEVTDWRLDPVGIGGRMAVLGHAAFQEEERTLALLEPQLSLRIGSRRTYLAATAGGGIAWVREIQPRRCNADDAGCLGTGRVVHEGFHPAVSLALGPVHHFMGGLALTPHLRLDVVDGERWSAMLVVGIGGTEFDR